MFDERLQIANAIQKSSTIISQIIQMNNTLSIISNIEMIDLTSSDSTIMNLSDMIEHTTMREVINLVNFSHNMRMSQTRTHLILLSYHSFQNLH